MELGSHTQPPALHQSPDPNKLYSFCEHNIAENQEEEEEEEEERMAPFGVPFHFRLTGRQEGDDSGGKVLSVGKIFGGGTHTDSLLLPCRLHARGHSQGDVLYPCEILLPAGVTFGKTGRGPTETVANAI